MGDSMLADWSRTVSTCDLLQKHLSYGFGVPSAVARCNET